MFKVKEWLFLFVSYLNKLIATTIASNLLSMVTYGKKIVFVQITCFFHKLNFFVFVKKKKRFQVSQLYML